MRARNRTEKGTGGITATTGSTRPGPDAGDDEGNTATTTAESEHDSLASATTTTVYESHAKFS